MTYYSPIDGETRQWLRREVDRAARKRLAARTPTPESTTRAVNFLLDALEPGPRTRAELVAEAEAVGIRESSLGKAKKRLGVEHARAGPGRTTWRLPGWREGA